nr:MAG TPA: hypothetical protein [Caudoviricetes sp.]
MRTEKRFTKKLLLEGATICKEYGYWSNEMSDFIYSFDSFYLSKKLCEALTSVYNSCQPKSSKYYSLLKENNLI